MEKIYLGNVQVAWTNGQFPSPPPRDNQPSMQQASMQAQTTQPQADDLPF
jgi:hypothetical protein